MNNNVLPFFAVLVKNAYFCANFQGNIIQYDLEREH